MIRIPSREIPQADTLDSVLLTVNAVAGGAGTYQAIAQSLGLDERQGRYYRLAAELLGFVRNTPGHNRAVLSPTGRQLVTAMPDERARLAAEAVLRARLVQRVIPFLESKRDGGASREEIEQFVGAVTQPTTQAMIHRRVSTVVSWLCRIGVLHEASGSYRLQGVLPRDMPVLEYSALDEPLSPARYDLRAYEEVARRARGAGSYLSVLASEAARERANAAHRMLTNLVARKIRGSGAIPRRNAYIDLSTVWARRSYLFEMKSTRERNAHAQIRKAVSQLYEYRYLQDMRSAKLVVVVENPLPRDKGWLIDYVVGDRGLLIAWDGDRQTLSYPRELHRDLQFLD